MSSNDAGLERERWVELERIFHEASELAPEDRDAYLIAACNGDAGLLKQARDLLKSSETADDYIEGAIGDAVDQVIKERDHTRKDKRLGAYRLIDIIGRGGMGTVYLADRDDKQYRQKVAIKLVKSALLDKQAHGRLKAERQILANLDHPNIARLLDGGATEDGDPYIVMEYIDGEPLMDFCDRRRLGIRDRIELFRDICSAVQYAHRNLVVHRDLKPSNILVTKDGVPKLLDFGIAKILDAGQTSYTVALTQENLRLLTPDYSSPEQVRGEAITTASDVYALGILLYELLTGRKPHTVSGTRHGEMLRVVCEQTPSSPSTAAVRVSEDGPDAELLAEYRGMAPDKLKRRLKGDLDNIILTALRKEPERRYESAQQFSEDLKRHLTGLPVAARPDTWGYRTGKFLRRNAVGVAMAATLLLLISGFGVNAYIQGQRIAEERDRYEQTAEFMINMFLESDPAESGGETITVKQLLEAGSKRTQTQLQQQPELRARLMATMGTVYNSQGLYDEAQDMQEESLEIRMDLFGYEHPDIAESLAGLAETLLLKGEFDRAESMLGKAKVINTDVLGFDSEAVAGNLHGLGRVYWNTDRFEDAQETFQNSIAMYEGLKNTPAKKVRLVKSDLARAFERLGHYDQAERIYLEILPADREALGPDHPQVMSHQTSLAALYLVTGQFDAARKHYEEAIEVMERVLGPNHPETIGNRSTYGRLLVRQGEFHTAEKVLRKVYHQRAEALDADHHLVGLGAVSLAEALHALGRHAEAEEYFQRGLELYAQSLPDDHQYVAAARLSLGSLYNDTGRHMDGRVEIEAAQWILRKSLPDEHIYIAKTELLLGESLAGLELYAEAAALCEKSWNIIDAARGEDDPLRQKALQVMVGLYESWGKTDLAGEYRALLARL